MLDLDDLPRAVTVTPERSRFLQRPTGRFTVTCSHCGFTSVNLDDYDAYRLVHDNHPACAETQERVDEIQALIDAAKATGDYVIYCRGQGLWVYRCLHCGWLGPDLPWPESAEREYRLHLERGAGKCPRECDNPFHPDPARRTRGY